MKLICTADIHLGRTSSLPSNLLDNQNEFTSENTWKKIIDLAIDEEADAILVAGDVFDKNTYEFTSKKILEESLKKLKGKNISVILTPGNHDKKLLEKIVNNIKLNDEYDFLKIIGCGCKWETLDFNGLQIISCGLDKEKSKDNPFKKFKEKNLISNKYILMVHGDYTSNNSAYAPIREDLTKGLVQNSIITLIGHTHKYENNDKYISLGSPQALDFGEKGLHGVLILDLNDGSFEIENKEYRQISNIYYDQININVSDEDDLLSLLNEKLVKQTDLTYYRVTLEGRVSEEKYNEIKNNVAELLKEEINGYINEKVYIDRGEFFNNVLPNYDIDAMCKQNNAIGEIAKKIKSIDDGDFIEKYKNDFIEFKTKFAKFYEIDESYFNDKELLDYIKQSLIIFLGTEKKGGK